MTEQPLRILLLCTRDPGGRQAGRKAVLKTIIRSLRALGHHVDVAVVGREPTTPLAGEFPGVESLFVPAPSLPRVVVNVLTQFSRGRLSLNECLFVSPRGRGRVDTIVADGGYDLVIVDMIRAVALASRLCVPVIVDLDDRLSRRYEEILRDGGDRGDLLGYVEHRVPILLRRVASRVTSTLLRLEVRVLARREVEVARRASAVSLVSRFEAAQLARDAGIPVTALPMAVTIRDRPVPVAANPGGAMAFVGGLDYHANAEAVRWFADCVLPRIRNERPDFVATVIGECPMRLRAEFTRPGLQLSGYISDLDAELSRQRGFLAPVRSGHGIKTKVLEAMAAGLPVVATPEGLAGLDAIGGENCLIAHSAQSFADAVLRLVSDSGTAVRIGAAGREYVTAHFSPPVLVTEWQRMLDRVA